MVCLAWVLEFHHPLPGPDGEAGADWSAAALRSYWPILWALVEHAEREAGSRLTLAVSPSWLALAGDVTARASVLAELDRWSEARRTSGIGKVTVAGWSSLHQFVADRWDGDALAAIGYLAGSGVVEVIPTTSTHTWLPSVAGDPVVARAQVRLAAADLALRLGQRPRGIWLPYLGYLPGLEGVLAQSSLGYFGVTADAFLRGTVLPPEQTFAPIVTPPGVAAFGCDSRPMARIVAGEEGYGRDRRYFGGETPVGILVEHAREFLEGWRDGATPGPGAEAGRGEPISVAAISVHDLAAAWPSGHVGPWLATVLDESRTMQGASLVTLGAYLERYPVGTLGRPGPSVGGFLAARPHGSDLFDRCRAAAELLDYAVERRHELDALGRRAVAQMTRALLRAQQVDWSSPPGSGIDPTTGLERARCHLDRFYELAGMLLSGRVDATRLDQLERGPGFLPALDIDLLGNS